MKLLDIINEIKDEDFTDDERLWLQTINFNLFYDKQGKKVKRLSYDLDDNPDFESEYGDINVGRYRYRLDESYVNFAVIECYVLLGETKNETKENG